MDLVSFKPPLLHSYSQHMIDPITSFATTVKLAEGGWKFISKFRPTYCMEAGETFLLEADKLTNEHFDKIPNDVLTEIHSKISQLRPPPASRPINKGASLRGQMRQKEIYQVRLTVENALAFSMIPMDTRKEYDVHIYLLDMPEHGVDLRVNDDSFDVPQSNTIWYSE
ncbi:hypothetical protein PHLCEN_2v9239 [Hermanssonia centrifuga]|uniref:Uncharacterized protein n=1 Tax=Hermanssonia centrifuga TaxID=98765 RepID=A0A2R6NS57_9APHY|nr:hypothetical protein PHLCEN_2v9239 [Hermanssonia centrifuga]